ncbi:MAG: hypothetical protein Q7J98_06365 [Kiritimatiellia bacterium]|nr:hypothetical protein [Kiritimatiellia bacterium]
MDASEKKLIEIICPACGNDALLKRTPSYDGFRRVGEKLLCSSCGHSFADEAEVPFKTKQQSALFDRSELEPRPRIFRDDDAMRLCRHCAHYVVNPFIQRCALQQKEVEATDSCARFTPHQNPD